MQLRYSNGVAAVEFAIVLPLFLLLVFGIVEFSFMLFDKAVITNASREAARAGIVVRLDNTTTPPANTKMSISEIQNIAANYCENHLISFSPATPVIQAVRSGINFDDQLSVQVNYTYTGLVIGKLLIALDKPFVISATTVMRNE